MSTTRSYRVEHDFGWTYNTTLAYARSSKPAAIAMPEYYKAIMLSEDPKILEMTSVLNIKEKNVVGRISKLESTIKAGMETGEFVEDDYKLIARIIWTANFGLTMRLIIEKSSSEKEIETLIKNQLGLFLKGLRKGSGKNGY